MIRIRKADGSCIEVNEPGTFVELVNDMDSTVMFAFLQVQPGTLLHIKPGTADADRYEQIFQKQGVVFSKTMIVRESK